MALEYGYFDSKITGYDDEGMPVFDRAQTSDFMASFFSKLITSGVCADPSDSFKVAAYDGMAVAISPGYAFIKGRFAYDTETAYLTLGAASSSYGRIDMIVLRNNYEDRLCEIAVKAGTPSASPEEPDLLQPDSGDYYELCLAKINVSAGATEITASDITDTRYDNNYCGIVTQLIDSIDISAFITEMQEAFNIWFEAVKGQLSEDAAGNLQNEIDALVSYGTEIPENGEEGQLFVLLES